MTKMEQTSLQKSPSPLAQEVTVCQVCHSHHRQPPFFQSSSSASVRNNKHIFSISYTKRCHRFRDIVVYRDVIRLIFNKDIDIRIPYA
ncbi:hypothetical protein TNIN_166121 [Trichonephila inaurata madagascariensis]|uniref:Uncharacterized protein n=1 Tax=Trichonephila inaurata madagascariensis TaxID=2747483 RepID=A0A8X7BQD1_9ARAC|nr:hypothetical protein TNIN_166121 [Trichonephila inaurata madagascariensis]